MQLRPIDVSGKIDVACFTLVLREVSEWAASFLIGFIPREAFRGHQLPVAVAMPPRTHVRRKVRSSCAALRPVTGYPEWKVRWQS